MTYHSKYSHCFECGVLLPQTKDKRQNRTRCRECANVRKSWKIKQHDFKPSEFCPIEQSPTAFA